MADSMFGFPVIELPGSAAAAPEAAIRFLIDQLVQMGRIFPQHADRVVYQVFESLGYTAIGQGVAVPHACSDVVVDELVGAVGKSSIPVPWPKARDDKPVHVVCLMVYAADHSREAVPRLLEICRKLKGDLPMNIEHIAINVADPVAMADWYTRHLGMHVVRNVGGPTLTHFIGDESGRVVIEIYHHTKAAVPDYHAMDPLVLHIAFVAPNMQETRDRLLKAGATLAADIAVTPAGDELCMLRDPWGVAVQLVKRAKPLLER